MAARLLVMVQAVCDRPLASLASISDAAPHGVAVNESLGPKVGRGDLRFLGKMEVSVGQ